MWQTMLFDEGLAVKIVNTASVPNRSPFRYPGGKTWFVPYIRRWLLPSIRQRYNLTPIYPEHFIEPFLGGGSISLAVASESLVPRITTVELDIDVAAVWQAVLDVENGEWLAQRILSYVLSFENVKALFNEVPTTVRQRAFQTIVKNRVNRGGILAPGAGLLKCGENGKGLLSRWYPSTLARRIHHIISIRNHILFIHGDGLQVLAEQRDNPDAVFFIDPPYTAGTNGKRAGRRLYRHNELDHEQLFDLASHIRGDFLMTYDNVEEVQHLAVQHGFDTRLIPMRNAHHASVEELLIGRNLDWLTLSELGTEQTPGERVDMH